MLRTNDHADAPATAVRRASSGVPVARHDGRLFRKYLVLILSLVSGALLVSGAISVYFSYQEQQTALGNLQEEKAVAAASRIEQYMRQIERRLAFAALPQLDPSDVELRRIEFLKLLRQVPEVTDIAHLDGDGRETVSVSRLGMDTINSGRDRSKEPGFTLPKRNASWFGPVYFKKETEPYMTVAVRSGGDNAPVTIAELNLKFIWDVVSRIKVGSQGKAYVVDRNGYLVADPDIGLVLRKTNLDSLAHVQAALRKVPSDDTVLRSHNSAGTSVLAAWAPIESLDWMVFVEQPVAEVYAKLNASILRTGLLLLAGLVVSAIVALVLARGMVRPIRTLSEGARRIGEGDLDQRIEINTGDELEALADRFNRMSTQLKESYAGLERKVEERTQELQNSLEQQRASGDVLAAISNSIADTAPVFETILASCERLFVGRIGVINLISDDGMMQLAAYHGPGRDQMEQLYPRPADATSTTGVAIALRDVVHYPDIDGQQDIPSGARAVWEVMHIKAAIGAPMIWKGQGIGSIVVGRDRPGPFSDKEIALLRTFADQAVIAIQNARLFREIADKSRQVEVANRHKSAFLASMSHELRTPLNAIIGFSEVLIERYFGELNDKQDDYLKDIHSSGKHLLALINEVLDLSKVEAGRMELDRSEFDVAAAMADAMTLIRERAHQHHITLKLVSEPGLGHIVADERRVKQILLNLLSNAVKFTPDSGSITLEGSRGDHGVTISVRDTGIGIAPADQEAVFEEFRQVGRDTMSKHEGTGLGLALCKRLVELHGGRIWLESAPGAGSTFHFTLPRLP